MKNGEVISGANVENASYPCCICAERNVLSSAYGKGYRKEDIVALALSSDNKEHIYPCGMCAQVIGELMDPDCNVYLINSKGDVKEMKVRKLSPYQFTLGGK